jgi:hypothetical protein
LNIESPAGRAAWLVSPTVNRRIFPGRTFDHIFLNDRNQDQKKREESNKIEEWPTLVGIIRESQRGAIYAFNQKRNSKEQKEAVTGIFPKAKEEQSRY